MPLTHAGFAANMGVVSSLCDGGNVDIFSDELNHASIVDGARLAVRTGAGATRLFVYRHNDLVHLEELLLQAEGAGSSTSTASRGVGGICERRVEESGTSPSRDTNVGRRRRLVVTDSLFSMDGDFADLRVRRQSCLWRSSVPLALI